MKKIIKPNWLGLCPHILLKPTIDIQPHHVLAGLDVFSIHLDAWYVENVEPIKDREEILEDFVKKIATCEPEHIVLFARSEAKALLEGEL